MVKFLIIFCFEYEKVNNSSPVVKSVVSCGLDAGIGPGWVVCCNEGWKWWLVWEWDDGDDKDALFSL